LYLSSLVGKEKVEKIISVLKNNDSELSSSLEKKKDRIESLIKKFREESEEQIREDMNKLSDKEKDLLVYRLLRDGLIKSLDFSIYKVNSLKELVFSREVK